MLLYAPWCPSTGTDADDVTARTARGDAALDVQPDQIFATALITTDPLARANAYRVFGDVAKKDDQRRAWAFNNSAHIYLEQEQFCRRIRPRQAGSGGRRESNAGMDLVRKSGSITAVAAEQLGDSGSAKFLRDFSAGKISYAVLQGKI